MAQFRATRDIDFLGKTDNSVENLVSVIKEICQIECVEDGVVFDASLVAGERIQQKNEYIGIRIKVTGVLANARDNIQVDVGFGDSVTPRAKNIRYPTLLGDKKPIIKGYAPETVIAEKFHGMVRHGEQNSRLKDFFDVWLLSTQFEFQAKQLADAIAKTFKKRKTTLDANVTAFSQTFVKNETRQLRWETYINKNELTIAPEAFSEVVSQIAAFINPLIQTEGIVTNQLHWIPNEGWVHED